MLLVCCTYICFLAAHTVHIRCTHTIHQHIACVLHAQKLAQHYMHATYMHMRSHTSEYMYATCVQMLCAAYMQLVMFSIHAACKQLHTNCIHFFICLYGMRVVLSQFLCMQHACDMDVLCVQHAYSIHV